MLRTHRHRAHLVICYKNFGAIKGLSHIGLGVSAMQNARVLRNAGYVVDLLAISSAEDIKKFLMADRDSEKLAHHLPITNLTISAPWIPTVQLMELCAAYPDIHFAVVSHSNIGFLQADPNAIKLLREGAELEQSYDNFSIAGNSDRLVKWWEATYQTEMIWLPNMYYIAGEPPHRRWNGGTLRIGCFCAVRPLKNVLNAAAGALEMGTRLRVSDLEFWMSGGRMEGGGKTIYDAVIQMYANMKRAKVVINNWEGWPSFRKTIGSMDLLIQPSYTESFNMVTADGISEGIPSVVSDAIDWAPSRWIASVDDALDIANVGMSLLHNPCAGREGFHALERHNEKGLHHWGDFLKLRG